MNTNPRSVNNATLSIPTSSERRELAEAYTRKNATDLLQPVAPSGLIQV